MCIFATITKPNITCDKWSEGEMIQDGKREITYLNENNLGLNK